MRDADGNVYVWRTCNRRTGRLLTGGGATMAGLISTVIGLIFLTNVTVATSLTQ